MLTDEQKHYLEIILSDFPTYAESFLKIRAKDGTIKDFKLNKAQLYMHNALEQQIAETGMVRAIILKGRQLGASTFIGARFFYKTITQPGKKTYILTHEQAATDNLFGMVNRYYEHYPDWLKPVLGASNAKELSFSDLESGYKVATAGNKGAGRSDTAQYVHGCIVEGTKVIDPTTGGLRNIESVEVGDLVITHTGKVAPVTFKSTQTKDCFEIKVKTVRNYFFGASGGHKLFTSRGWIEVKDLKVGDRLGNPVLNREYGEPTRRTIPLKMPDNRLPGRGGAIERCDEHVELNYDFGRFVGAYLADGNIKKQHKGGNFCAVTISDDLDQIERLKEWFGKYEGRWCTSIKYGGYNEKNTSRTRHMHFYGKSIACCIGGFVGDTTGKQLPFEWWNLPVEFLFGMLHGYMAGDGHYAVREVRYTCCGIRDSVIVGIRGLMAFLGYGWAGLNRREAGVRSGRNEKEQYHLSLAGRGAVRLREDILEGNWYSASNIDRMIGLNNQNTPWADGCYWPEVEGIEPIGERRVYDLEVGHEDHSYCLVHGAVSNSELAWWPNAEDHLAGLLQTVPLAAGTEIIFESTAKGIGNVFHDIWEKGVARKGGWLAIFIPWHWQEEYRTRGVEIDNEDREYGAIHGLDEEQMMWRRYKIDELGSEALFKQEYPTTAAEAFEISSEMSFMDSIPVAKARKAEGILSDGVTILGVDPARKGLDKTVVTLRRGRVAEVVSRVNGDDTMATVGSVLKLIAKYRPNAVFCDIGGIGAGIVDRLRELGHKNVRGVDFGSSPMNKKLYVNKRNEMWGLMKEWILSEGGVKIPDSDSLQIDLCGILIARYDSHNRAILESKDEFRKRFKRSPDEGDSLALTFAYPVVDYEAEGLQMRAYGEAAEYFEGDRVTVPGMGY